MDRPLLMTIVVAFLVVLLALMLIGWRRRQRSQAGFPRPQAVPADPGAELMAADAFYVATTVAAQPLNRIAVAGLGYRARAAVTVTEGGLSLAIPGQDAIFIPAGDIRAVEKATWTIDRVVEPGGMLLVRWAIGDPGTALTEVDSYLRVIDPVSAGRLFTAVQRLHDPGNQADSPQTDSPQTGNPQTGGRAT